MIIHLKTLTKEAKKLLPSLNEFKGDFYLAGGTGLSLLIGHRVSVDFDLFTEKTIKKSLITKVNKIFKDFPLQIMVSHEKELTVLVNSVKITFLHYPFPLVAPLRKTEYVSILSAKEILATKAYTIGRRDEMKDYIDLYCGLKKKIASLKEIIDSALKKFGSEFNDRIFLEQLLYFDDIVETDIIMFDFKKPTKKELLNFFSKEVNKLKIKNY